MDFDEFKYTPEKYFIKLPTPEPIIEEPDNTSIEELIDRHISSPKTDEIFLPLSIDTRAMNKYTLNHNKKHKKRKTHVTHKLVKKTKSKTNRSKSPKSKSKSRTSRSKSIPIFELL